MKLNKSKPEQVGLKFLFKGIVSVHKFIGTVEGSSTTWGPQPQKHSFTFGCM